MARDYLGAAQRLGAALLDQHSDGGEVLVRGWRCDDSLTRLSLSELRGVGRFSGSCFAVLQEIVASCLFVNPLWRR